MFLILEKRKENSAAKQYGYNGLFSTFYPRPHPSIALFFVLKKLTFTVMRICFFISNNVLALQLQCSKLNTILENKNLFSIFRLNRFFFKGDIKSIF